MAKHDRDLKETTDAMKKLAAFHACIGKVVACEWDVFVAEIQGLLKIKPAVTNSLRAVAVYGKCDGGWMFQG